MGDREAIAVRHAVIYHQGGCSGTPLDTRWGYGSSTSHEERGYDKRRSAPGAATRYRGIGILLNLFGDIGPHESEDSREYGTVLQCGSARCSTPAPSRSKLTDHPEGSAAAVSEDRMCAGRREQAVRLDPDPDRDHCCAMIKAELGAPNVQGKH
jgi:hypothetical protein